MSVPQLVLYLFQYTHSLWHLCLSLSLLALLPAGGGQTGGPSDLLPLVPSSPHEMAELGTRSPTFCRAGAGDQGSGSGTGSSSGSASS